MPTFDTNPNQKIISVLKDGKAVCDAQHIYLKAQKEAMFAAMKNLTPTNFEVWLYLASQSDNYTFAFSPAAITNETGIKKSSLQEGIRVLIREHYLIQRNDGSNIYDFYEVPRVEDPDQEDPEIQIQVHKNAAAPFKF